MHTAAAVTDSLTEFARRKLAALEAQSLRRTLKPTRRIDGLWVERDGCSPSPATTT